MVEQADGDGAALAVGALPGAGAGPGQERFDVGAALQLVEAGHVRVVLGEVVGEHDERLDPGVDAGGGEHGAQRLGVADNLGPDLRLLNRFGAGGRGAGDAAGLAPGPHSHAQLVEAAAQAQDAFVEHFAA